MSPARSLDSPNPARASVLPAETAESGHRPAPWAPPGRDEAQGLLWGATACRWIAEELRAHPEEYPHTEAATVERIASVLEAIADQPSPATAIARAVATWAANAERPEHEPEPASAPPYLTLADSAEARRETGVYAGEVTIVGPVAYAGAREVARLRRGRWHEPSGAGWRALVFEPLA